VMTISPDGSGSRGASWALRWLAQLLRGLGIEETPGGHQVPVPRESSLRLYPDRGTPPCCDVMLSVQIVTMTFMSELPAGDTHDVIRQSGEVVAVVVPIEEYQQLRQAMQEQQVNEEFDAARASYQARREAGAAPPAVLLEVAVESRTAGAAGGGGGSGAAGKQARVPG
jgi:hypothetical protein